MAEEKCDELKNEMMSGRVNVRFREINKNIGEGRKTCVNVKSKDGISQIWLGKEKGQIDGKKNIEGLCKGEELTESSLENQEGLL